MKRGTPRHPKVAHLRELLKINLAVAVGYLELLWHFTAEFAPQGDIGRFSDKQIEAALGWSGKRGHLISSLVDSKWIDRHLECRLVVHGWREHADESVKKRLHRAGLPFLEVTAKMSRHRQTSADNGSLPEPEPEPLSAAETAAVCDLAAETFDLTDEERQEALNRDPLPKHTLLNPEVETVLDQVARRIHDRHPPIRRCGMAEVKKQLRAIARTAPAAKRVDVLHQVDRNHTGWCAWPGWTNDGGAYAKGLANWLAPTLERWNEPPPERNSSDEVNEYGHPRLMM